MANVKCAMEYAAKIDRAAMEKRLHEWVGLTDEERLNTEINRLHQCLRNVYEVWAGSEGIPAPTVASEAYLLSLVEQMRDAAKEGLNGG